MHARDAMIRIMRSVLALVLCVIATSAVSALEVPRPHAPPAPRQQPFFERYRLQPAQSSDEPAAEAVAVLSGAAHRQRAAGHMYLAAPEPTRSKARSKPAAVVVPQPRPEPESLPEPEPAVHAPARIPGDGPAMPGTLVMQTERLDVYVGRATFTTEQVAALAPLLEQALRDDEVRFGTTLDQRASIAIYRLEMSRVPGARALAFSDENRIEMYYHPDEDPARAIVVGAHELGHLLEAQRYGDEVQRRADTILHEGLATWIASDYWLPMCSATTWKERARAIRDHEGLPLRLLAAEEYPPNMAYEIWASFVDFLYERYSPEQVDALYRSGRGRVPGSADYEGVLGVPLDQLADAWRAWVDS